MRPAHATWLWRLGACAVVVGALAYIPYRVYGSQGYVRYRLLARQLGELSEGNVTLRRENDALRRENQRLENDPRAIEEAARDDLGMVGDGELVLQIERVRAPVVEPPPRGAP